MRRLCDTATVLLGITAIGGSDSRISLRIHGLSRDIFGNNPVLSCHDHGGWLPEVGLGGLESRMEIVVRGDIPDGFGDSRIGHVIVAQDADDSEANADRSGGKRMLVVNKPATGDPARIIRRIVDELMWQADDRESLPAVRRNRQVEGGNPVEGRVGGEKRGQIGGFDGGRGDGG